MRGNVGLQSAEISSPIVAETFGQRYGTVGVAFVPERELRAMQMFVRVNSTVLNWGLKMYTFI